MKGWVENTLFVMLGEITLLVANLFDHVSLSEAGRVFMYALLAGAGGLIPKLCWEGIKWVFSKRTEDI